MNKVAQIIVTPSGERLAVLPEEDYLAWQTVLGRGRLEQTIGRARRPAPRRRVPRRTTCNVGSGRQVATSITLDSA